MVQWFKKHFIPHEGNDHQPHILRSGNIRLIVIAIFVIELGVMTLPYIPIYNSLSSSFLAAVLPGVLDDLTNKNRQNDSLPVLAISPVLNEVATLKAQDMASKGYFAHISPDGKTPWYWFNQVGYKYEFAGENLAVDFTDSTDVALAWMNSPAHRANILKNQYTEMGTGVATGTYQGNPTVFVAQVFGSPVRQVVAVAVAVAKDVAKAEEPPVQVATQAVVPGVRPEVLGIATDSVAMAAPAVQAVPVAVVTQQSSVTNQFLTSPRHLLNIIFTLIGAIIAIAVALKLFIRMDKKHPALITNGLVVIVIILGIFTVNGIITRSHLANTTSFASFTADAFDSNK